MQNSNRSLHLLTLAIVLLSFGQIVFVGCRSHPPGQVFFTIENLTNQQIDKVTISGFDPRISSSLTTDSLGGEGELFVLMLPASSPIVLPKTCNVILHFPDGTTSEVDVPVESKTSSDFTGTLAFKIRATDNVQLVVTSD